MSETLKTQEAAEKRLARRYRAEQRFQIYGQVAIGVACTFLLVLIASITVASFGAFTHHRLSLTVNLDAELVDPRGDRSADSLRRGAYNQVIQNALLAEFPDIEGRSAMRELFGLYSAINAADLLVEVAGSPELVGQSVEFELPISDEVDLFLKGESVRQRVETIYPEVEIEAVDGEIRIVSNEGIFTDFIAQMGDAARTRADRLEARADEVERRLEMVFDRNERETLLAEIERTRALAAQERERAESAEGYELGPQMASLFVRHNGGIVRINRINAVGSEGYGEIFVPASASNQTMPKLWIVETPSNVRTVSDRQMALAHTLRERGLIRSTFNGLLFTNADSREPELAGVIGAVLGSILTMFVTMFLAVPIGVSAAIYLEEFAPKNRLTDFIEVNINNLAAVPSIVFGLLGLSIFINFVGLPRSAPIVGGLVLALMTLPTVIISSRAALKAVPSSIRDAALGVGASRTQAVFHHVLPMALPGILTGSIIGLAQAFGETAPLLMIGIVAFIADPPSLSLSGFFEPATVMPVQIYIWSTGAERAFEARTAAAILLLMIMMLLFNALAIYLRRRFERRW
jgi:phosphate transport system permease protein